MRNLCDVNRGQALTGSYSTKLQGNREWGSRRPTPPHATPRHPTRGNGQSGMGNRGGRPPHTAPHRVFFTAASPRFIISHSHDSPFPIAHSLVSVEIGAGWGADCLTDSPFPIADSPGRGRLVGGAPFPHLPLMSTNVTLDAVEETPVWLEVNGTPAVTWMCTPDQLDELVIGWLHGEGYIDSTRDILRMRPCAKEPGFWVDVPPEKFAAVESAERRRVLASG